MGTPRSIFSSTWITKLKLLLVYDIVHVSARGNAGQAVTGGVTDVPFTEVFDSRNIFNGTQITMPFDGIMIADCAVNFGGIPSDWAVSTYIDGVLNEETYTDYKDAIGFKRAFFHKKLNQGQVVSFRAINISGSLVNAPNDHYLNATIMKF